MIANHRTIAMIAGAALGAASLVAADARGGPNEAVEQMLSRVLRAAEVQSRVVILRSDPFGGPDERTEGEIWLLPGRGLRFRTAGEDLVLDRTKDLFLVYRRSEKTAYRATWDRAPARLRHVIEAPETLLDKDLDAAPERRSAGGAMRAGYRLRRAALGDSLPSVKVWLAADPGTGLPRWASVSGEEDSVRVEFRGMTVLSKANPRDLSIPLPRGVRTQPLDPRDLLPGGESR